MTQPANRKLVLQEPGAYYRRVDEDFVLAEGAKPLVIPGLEEWDLFVWECFVLRMDGSTVPYLTAYDGITGCEVWTTVNDHEGATQELIDRLIRIPDEMWGQARTLQAKRLAEGQLSPRWGWEGQR